MKSLFFSALILGLLGGFSFQSKAERDLQTVCGQGKDSPRFCHLGGYTYESKAYLQKKEREKQRRLERRQKAMQVKAGFLPSAIDGCHGPGCFYSNSIGKEPKRKTSGDLAINHAAMLLKGQVAFQKLALDALKKREEKLKTELQSCKVRASRTVALLVAFINSNRYPPPQRQSVFLPKSKFDKSPESIGKPAVYRTTGRR